MVGGHHTLLQLVAPVIIVLVAIIRPIVCYSSAIDIGSKWHPEPSYTCSTRNGWLPLFSLTGLLYTLLLQTIVDETSARFRSSYETVNSRDGQSSFKLDGVRSLVRPSGREAVCVLGFLTFLITSESHHLLPHRARATRAERDASCACCRRQRHHPQSYIQLCNRHILRCHTNPHLAGQRDGCLRGRATGTPAA